MKIYEFRAFPNPLRARMAAAEKGLTDRIEFVQVNVPNGEHKLPEFLQLNPVGKVPVLVLDDDTAIAECTAITEYLDHSAGTPVLTGETPKQRAQIHMLQRRAEALVLDAISDYFHHATAGLGKLEPIQIKEWGEYQRQVAIKGMHYFDGVLRGQHYLLGEHLTMPDITLFAGLKLIDFMQIGVPDTCKHLLGWRERVGQRPSAAA
ncbi:glutathione S-transferase family protein [Methylomonas koyamae]|uniref:glutathione S-transferase family protein n=1 Tax=Methylomonas koyamae TaxID=702114 RepID=UPI00112A5D37|nr:glutathione S-transferase [Methylomonas koyamae]TPQ25932.1 glutathione S-transferase [Methylomonas koyamae]